MEEEHDNFILLSKTSTRVENSTQDVPCPECYICKRSFSTNIELLQHFNTCRKKNHTTSNVDVNIENQSTVVQKDLTQQQDQEREKFYWSKVPGSVYRKDLEGAYEQIVYWLKNVFMIPTGASGKFFNEIIGLLDK